jgi:hypothetical protein
VTSALADQGFKSSVVSHGADLGIDVQVVERNLSVAVELGLKAAAAAARLVLKAGKSPPGGGSVRRRSAPVLAEITAWTHHGPTSLQIHKSRPVKGLLKPGAPPGT